MKSTAVQALGELRMRDTAKIGPVTRVESDTG